MKVILLSAKRLLAGRGQPIRQNRVSFTHPSTSYSPLPHFRHPNVPKRFVPAKAPRLLATSSASRCPWAPGGTAPGPPAAGCLCASVLQCVSLQQGEAFQESPPISVIRTPLFSPCTMQLYATPSLSSPARSRELPRCEVCADRGPEECLLGWVLFAARGIGARFLRPSTRTSPSRRAGQTEVAPERRAEVPLVQRTEAEQIGRVVCSWPPCCHGALLILMGLASLGKAQGARKSTKRSGRAAVRGSAGGTRGCDTWGAWVGGAGALLRGSVPSWGQCHLEAEPRKSFLPRGCPRARCWGSGGLCLLRCRTLDLCLRPTAGTLVARCLHPCSLGFCTRIPWENRLKPGLEQGTRGCFPPRGGGSGWPGPGVSLLGSEHPRCVTIAPRGCSTSLPEPSSLPAPLPPPRQARAPRVHSPRTPQTPWASVLLWAGAGSCFQGAPMGSPRVCMAERGGGGQGQAHPAAFLLLGLSLG